MLTKIRQLAIICAISSPLVAAEVAPPKPWIVMLDWQNQSKQDVSHSTVAGSYGRSRSGIEAIYKTEDTVIDLEYYNYSNDFSGALASSDRHFGKTSD
jgi:hypothetical protein